VELEARLIDDLLDLTRITRGKLELHRRGTDAHQVSAKAAPVQWSAWSPDGTAMVVQRGTGDRTDLWILDLEGNYLGQVTHGPSSYGFHSWAPAPR